MSLKILFIVPYPHDTAPSQRLKFEQYYDEFEKAGFEITVSPFIRPQFWEIIYKRGSYFKKAVYTIAGYFKRYAILKGISKYDVVYIHLWSTPLGLPVHEWFLCKLSKKIVYDIDDLVYKGNSSPSNKLIEFLKTSSKVNYLMKHANHVLVSTDKLFEYAQQFTNNVSCIPATIDVKKYVQPRVDKLNNSVVIGWSGSHTTSRYLHLLDGVLKQLATKYPIKIMVMGDPEFAIEGLDVELIAWSPETEINSLLQFDIGLHPVPDEEWVYGKSGGKLVQYMAAGVPIVATAIGPNFKAIQDGYNGFLASTDEEWVSKLTLLISDEALRKQMGLNSRKMAINTYSVEANLDKYLAVFEK